MLTTTDLKRTKSVLNLQALAEQCGISVAQLYHKLETNEALTPSEAASIEQQLWHLGLQFSTPQPYENWVDNLENISFPIEEGDSFSRESLYNDWLK